jgi:hypothetical protein
MYSMHMLEHLARAQLELPADCVRNPRFFEGGPAYGMTTFDRVMLERYGDLLDRQRRWAARPPARRRRVRAWLGALVGRNPSAA